MPGYLLKEDNCSYSVSAGTETGYLHTGEKIRKTFSCTEFNFNILHVYFIIT